MTDRLEYMCSREWLRDVTMQDALDVLQNKGVDLTQIVKIEINDRAHVWMRG